MRTIAIVNQKGGCGKTTTAINLSAVLAHRGLRTLLVDIDPQSHCATGLGVPEKGIDQSIGEALIHADDETFDPSSVVWEVGGNLDLLPSTMRLAGLEAPGGGLHELADRDRRLARLLARFGDRYDRCLIDCPPTIGLLTFNALRAAREALIPVETGFFAFRGADKQWRTIRQLIERIGRPIACHLVPTLYNAESSLATDILAALQRQFAGQVIPVVLHEDEVVREAASFGQAVIEYAPESGAHRDFEQLADWLEEHPMHTGVQIEVMPGRAGETGTGPRAAPGAAVAAAMTAAPDATSPQGRAAELARRVRGLHAPAEADPAPRPAPRETETPPPAPARKPLAAVAVGSGYGATVTPGGVHFVQPGGSHRSIFVAGDFNRWSPTATRLDWDETRRACRTVVEIPPGTYRYRLIVDGKWQADPYNSRRQRNEYDETNSVLVVPQEGG